MRRLAFSLVIHNHQPVGNFDHVVAAATERAYEPMIAALERHPRVRVGLHVSGPLLDWLRDHRPDVMTRIRGLAARGQVEILTGAYYEPILPAIPDADKRGQIEKMTRTIAEAFGCAAEGLWLAERVWEPHLARPLGEAGIRYTVVDDTHFRAVGLDEAALLGYYVTEEQGVTLALFPSLRRLRYLIPWAPVEEVLAYLRTLAETDVRTEGREGPLDLALMGDDGEKFGMWPGTYEHCWGRRWVENFFDALEAAPWIELVPPGEYLRTRDPAGRIYLPTATYEEMAEWALPPDRARQVMKARRELESHGHPEIARLVCGGFWRHFLVKYPEANTLHHLSLRASRKVHAMPPGPEKSQALEDLWRGQCNCPYWHGLFGGVYLPHLRGAAFGHLIAAEAAADSAHRRGPFADVEAEDLNGDSRPEVRLATELVVCTIDPARGGAVVEWDDRTARRHLGNVVARRPEVYHLHLRSAALAASGGEKLESPHVAVRVKDPQLEELLVYDRGPRPTLRAHLWPVGTTRDQVWRDQQTELGQVGGGAYGWDLLRRPHEVGVRLTRRAQLGPTDAACPHGATDTTALPGIALVERTVTVASGHRGLTHALRLVWQGQTPLHVLVAEEWNIGVFGEPGTAWVEDAFTRHTVHEPAALENTARLRVVEGHSGLVLAYTLSPPATVWSLPLYTVSNSEAGMERTYQGIMLVAVWEIALSSGTAWEQTTRCAVMSPP
jgi:hypothetical protein